MSPEALGRLLLIVAVLIILGIGIQRKIFKRPHFYWAIACGILALLSTLLVTKCQSVYLQVAGVLLTLIFLLLVMCILMAGTMGQKRPLADPDISVTCYVYPYGGHYGSEKASI